MKLANLALAEMTEALTLQEERAGVKVDTTPQAIREALSAE